MKKIEIFLDNLNNQINIDINVDLKKVIINGKERNILSEQINDLLGIIQFWEKEYLSSNIIDSESFLIKITWNDKTEIIRGRGKYPKNYTSFIEWINDLYE